MLNKLLFTILTAMTLMLAGMTASLAGPGDYCADGVSVCDCDGDGYAYGYAYGHKNGNGDGDGDGDGDRDRDRDRDRDGSCTADEADSTTVAADLTADEILWLTLIRAEEEMARDSYLDLGDLWNLLIFDNLAVSEQKHMDAMENLFDCSSLIYTVPDVVVTVLFQDLQAWFDSLVTDGSDTSSVLNGLNAGAAIEETQIAHLQLAKDATGNMDIISTYESLQCASSNHLRAFVRQIEINGTLYDPIILEDSVFEAIIASPMDQNCGSNKKGQDDS